MLTTLHIITLNTVKYSDRTSILTAYSRESGRISFAIQAGNGREAARRRALLMPLSVVECVADVVPGRELLTMREPRALMPAHMVHMDAARSVIALFICDVLGAVLRESQPDELMWDFVADAVAHLNDESVQVANFPLAFMVLLSRFTGVEPDWSGWSTGSVFDMSDGIFRATPPLHRYWLGVSESALAASLGRITWRNMRVYRFNREQRARILDMILQYYTLHYANLSNLKSIEVLHALFD
ncbi:MAG: DNA repair protein RecO [Muribaculaceae bacterium]|nr:DNA repair protein RecO [Muribaculaceae bacterium]